MNYFDKNKTDRIEKLEKKLYSKNIDLISDIRTGPKKKEYNEERDWNDGDQLSDQVLNREAPVEKPNAGIFWTILVLAALFFFGALGYAAYVFWGGEQTISTDDVSVSVIGPVSVGGGDKLSVDVLVQNNSPVTLEAVNLVVDYPEGTKAVDLKADLTHDRIDLGDMSAGSVVKKTLDMAFLGENGETKSVSIKAEYHLTGSTALFNKAKNFDITLSAAPVQISVNGLDKISAGQKIDLDLEIRSNSEKTINNLMFVAEYPFGFALEKTSVKPTYGNNVWVFGDFAPTDVKNIKITGTIQAQDNENRVFRFSAGTPKDNNPEELGITLTNTRHVVAIEKPFIDLQFVINNSKEPVVVVGSGKTINADVVFANNTNNIVRDVSITLFLEGAALDKSSVNPIGGFYSSFDNKIVYNKDTLKDLAEVEPRHEVNIMNVLKTLDLSKNNRNLIDTEIRVSGVVSGRRVSESGVDEQIEEKDFVTMKLLSDVVFETATAHNTATSSSSGIVDIGPIPPKVNTETTYTVTWTINNSTSDIKNTKVIGVVPSYVTWKDKISPTSEDITYDPNTRRIIWNAGDISAGSGHSSPSKKVSFQISLLPSISQVQKFPTLIDKITISAFDDFSDQQIEETGDDVTTIIKGRDISDFHHYVVQ